MPTTALQLAVDMLYNGAKTCPFCQTTPHVTGCRLGYIEAESKKTSAAEELDTIDRLLCGEEIPTILCQRDDYKFCTERLFPVLRFAKYLESRLPKESTIEDLKADDGYGWRHYEVNFTDAQIVDFRKMLSEALEVEIDPPNNRKDLCTA
jgi:hypothetical protein